MSVMLKSLIKKQLLELGSYFAIGKKGKRSTKAIIGIAVLLVYAFAGSGIMFYMMASFLCEPLVQVGHGWVYFALMGVLSMGISVIGGVFMSKALLYEAKDNDLLLSMPIPTWAILFVRVVTLYVFTLPFAACIVIPAFIKYMVAFEITLTGVLTGIFSLFLLPLLGVAICVLVGFLLAWISAKIPFKNVFIVLGFFAFMIAYSLMVSKMNEYLVYIITHGEELGGVMQTWMYLLAQFGKAAMGDALALIIFIGIICGVFALVYALLSFTYLRVATQNRGGIRGKYQERKLNATSLQFALIKKDFLRLIKTPAYLLNASMGTMIVVICIVMAGVYGDFFGVNIEMINAIPELQKNIGLIAAVAILFFTASNTISACSISLEGVNLNILRSMPIGDWEFLKGKLSVHFLFTAIPTLIVGVMAAFIWQLDWYMGVGICLTAVIGSALFAEVGLTFNLLFPNFDWTNETAAVKQSMSVLFAMLGSWGSVLLPVGVFFLINTYLPAIFDYITAPISLYGWLCLYACAAVVLWIWLKERGTQRMRKLSV